MIKVSVMYKNGDSIKFDTDYYKNNHLPMVIKALGDALKGIELDLGIGNGVPNQPATYIAIAHLKFNDIASFQKAFGPHAATFATDVKNYTNGEGELQISELITY